MNELEPFLADNYEQTAAKRQSDKDYASLREEMLKGLRKALGEFACAPDMSVTVLEKKEFDDYIRERIALRTSGHLSMPVYMLTPKNKAGLKPAAIAVHGHGYGSREIVGLTADGAEDTETPGIHQHFALQLVRRGFKVFAPEIVGFGDRMLESDREKGLRSSCNTLSRHLLMSGRTLAGLRVHETLQLLKLIHTDPDVDAGRIGMMGFSGGGLIAAYASALDERVKATVLCGFTNTFKKSILAVDHCIDNYIPGILDIAELPDLIGLIAPRALFIESGANDRIFPEDGTREAIARLKEIYAGMQAADQLDEDIFEGAHEISGRRSYDWLAKTLIE
ncbi:dienelactone hydrolase [Paenibacillus nanensis]|uniref:Dienelactone hydrolase n=1 Tax=Paenibacillus nanensis TaxID=393251 RepID=A0A3A1V2K9_9BACL|nr:alpha/beta hydrolase family protein [Paenibacillus nanensis]RIX52793.1 dienelactone hydrolase [Paenibacillus nanensis]